MNSLGLIDPSTDCCAEAAKMEQTSKHARIEKMFFCYDIHLLRTACFAHKIFYTQVLNILLEHQLMRKRTVSEFDAIALIFHRF